MGSGMSVGGFSMSNTMPPFIRTQEGQIVNPHHVVAVRKYNEGAQIFSAAGKDLFTTYTDQPIDDFAREKLKMEFFA